MRSLLVIIVLSSFLVASCFAGGFAFSGNVSLTSEEENTLKLRSTSHGVFWSLGFFRNWFKSVEIVGESGTINGDVIFGETMGGLDLLPAAYITYFTGNVNIVPSGTNITLDINASAAFIAQAFASIQEVDPSGNVVVNVGLKGAIGGAVSWTKDEEGSADGLAWFTLKGTQSGKSTEIYITFLTSDKVGVINKANAVITPRTVESIVGINNWPYVSNENHLVLKTLVGTGSASLDKNAVFSGSGTSKVFAAIQGSAEISGSSSSVTVTATASADLGILDDVLDIKNYLTAKFGSSANLALFDVAFPAGAAEIVWDPTIGQGEPLGGQSPQNNSSSALVASLVFLLVALFAALF